jgi:hypothetical protein
VADGALEREWLFIHLARWQMNAGRLTEARRHLNAVTNAALLESKGRVLRNLNEKEPSAKAGTRIQRGQREPLPPIRQLPCQAPRSSKVAAR